MLHTETYSCAQILMQKTRFRSISEAGLAINIELVGLVGFEPTTKRL